MQNRTTLGVFYLCLGIFVFSTQDAIIKAVSGDYALTEILAARCLVSVPILAGIVHFDVGLGALWSKNFWVLSFRAFIMFLAYTSYYMAFPALPLADAVALFFMVPLFTVAFASLLLGETIGWRRIAAVLVGFAGVIVMLRPGQGLFEPAALLSLLSAATYALSMVMARKLGTTEPASVMGFYQNGIYLTSAVAIVVFLNLFGIHEAVHPSLKFLVRDWTMPSLRDLALIASCGVIAAVGVVLLTQAYRIAKASVVTSFEYTGMLWAPLWGFLFFGEIPHVTTIIGAVLIVVAGLFALSGQKDADLVVAP